jgi:ElaB/YqjD/DUF883 family membrane-anchored ribosome-binding protein
MGDTKKNFTDGIQATTDAAKEAMEDGIESIGKRGSRVSDAVSTVAAESGRAVKQAYSEVADKARESYEYGREKVAGLGAALEDQVRARPLTTLLVVVGIGLVGGFLLRAAADRESR